MPVLLHDRFPHRPCRLTYTYRGKTAAWLSPRDVCLRDDLPALSAAGACSVKLEGRLKRPEYVAVVAGSYKGAVERFAPASEGEKRDLMQIFQRGDFMRGYALGVEDAGVICPERVNHGGVPIGAIEAVTHGMARMRTNLPLHDGDGLQLRGGAGDQEMIYAGPEVPAGNIALLRLRPDMRVKASDAVVRLTDARQLEEARAIPLPSIPVDLTLTALPGQPLTLAATDGASTVTVTGEIVSPAEKRAMTDEDARRSLGKMGDTAFALRSLTVITESAFVPVSSLNTLRREAIVKLAAARAEAFARQPGRVLNAPEVSLPQGYVPTTFVVRNLGQYEAVRGQDARVVWYPEDFREERLADMPDGAWLHLPMVCEEATLRMLHRFVTENAHRLGGVVLGSVGQLGLPWPVPFGAGEGIPVMNRRAAQALFDAGCQFATASGELSAAELETLMAGCPPLLVPAYGRAQLMLLHHCPARTALGLNSGHSACRLCDQHSPEALESTSLTDRRGYSFPLLRQRLPEGCLVRLMNSLPTDVLARVRAAGWSPLISLTDEPSWPPPAGQATSAHWNRPVE